MSHTFILFVKQHSDFPDKQLEDTFACSTLSISQTRKNHHIKERQIECEFYL